MMGDRHMTEGDTIEPVLPVQEDLKRYCVGFMFDPAGRVALVRKNRPKWQEGLLNGIGGKLEPGETALTGMAREWKEETDHDLPDEAWDYFHVMRFPDAVIHFFRVWVERMPVFPDENDVGEKIEVYHADNLPEDELIPNLRWLIPLAADREFHASYSIAA
jgi:8-oxo-dGTP diphosphatase